VQPDEGDDLVFALILAERLLCVLMGFVLVLHLIAGAHPRQWMAQAVAFLISTVVLMLTWAIVDLRAYMSSHHVGFRALVGQVHHHISFRALVGLLHH
jgi:membrane protein implicated in regulation of membrane protease activity